MSSRQVWFRIAAGVSLLAAASSAAHAADETADGAALVRQYQCVACHAIKDMELRIGPPFPAVALRYAKADDATVQGLANKIINGGAGAWGMVPMVQHPQLRQVDAEQVVRWILRQPPVSPAPEKPAAESRKK